MNIVKVENEFIKIRAKTSSHNKGSQKVLEQKGFILDKVIKDGVELNGRIFDFLEYYWSNVKE